MQFVISPYELFLYYCIWISALALSLYKLFEAQNEIFNNYPTLRTSLRDLEPGWTSLAREKDVSDIEWICWKYFLQNSWFYFLLNFFISEILRKCSNQILKCWYLLSSLIYVLLNIGAIPLLVVLIQPVIYFMLLVCGGKRFSIWITSVALLHNIFKIYVYFWHILEQDWPSQRNIHVLVAFALPFIELRCISFSIDYVDNEEKRILGKKCTDNSSLYQTFINMFSYVLYLPLLLYGPIILYEEFENNFQFKIEALWPRLKRFTLDMMLFGIYSFLLELALHYMYFCAMINDIKLIKELPSLALCGAGLWMSFRFQVKYVILYGTMGSFARLDNMEAPPTPRCIARIHVYSLMWRYFDVGLYKFLVKYIYKPSYGTLCKYTNMSNTLHKMLATFFTFSFTHLWHGFELNIVIWTTLNYCGILLEQLAKEISTTNWYKNFKLNVLKTEGMEARLIAILCALLLTISAVSNFYFFGGTEVGNLFVAFFQWPALHNVMYVLISTYCCAHVSMSLLDVTSRTDIKRPRINNE